MMLMLDKMASALISPLGTALLLGTLAVFCGWRRRPKMAMVAGTLAVLWLGLWSLPVVSNKLLDALESPYPPIDVAALPRVQAIVVLGGGMAAAETRAGLPDLNLAADREWHAARLYKAGKAPWVLVSAGRDPQNAYSGAQAMRRFLLDLGVPDEAIGLEEQSLNTRQNARFCAEILRSRGIKRILLVTSAMHMPRSVSLFEAEGLEVIPAAADHEAHNHRVTVQWLPSTDALDGSARAFKEVVGKVTGR